MKKTLKKKLKTVLAICLFYLGGVFFILGYGSWVLMWFVSISLDFANGSLLLGLLCWVAMFFLIVDYYD